MENVHDHSPVPVVIKNDKSTPYPFVGDLISEVFSIWKSEAQALASTAHWHGEAIVGWYPKVVADALVLEARRRVSAEGHKLYIGLSERSSSDDAHCSFCGKPATQAAHLMTSAETSICDTCITRGSGELSKKVGTQNFSEANQLIGWHFAQWPIDSIVTSFRQFPAYVRADLQLAADKSFGPVAVRKVGIDAEHHYEPLTFAALLQKNRPKTIAPIQFEDVDVGGNEPIACAENCLWLGNVEGILFAILLARHRRYDGRQGIRVEIAVPAGEQGASLAAEYFKSLSDAVAAAGTYRGRVLSLEESEQFSGQSAGIKVHRLPAVSRSEVILPEQTLALLDRNVLDFAKNRARLRELGLSPRKGVLLYGPPGTGKTHTIRYLASALPDHTTLLITAEQVGLISQYFALARLLQPSLMVIEDADLIARSRTEMDGVCEEVLLNKLLNEMDGLKEDAEIFFVLTTNRPEQLERALAGRPGRIDQAIEVPLPDEAGREKLVNLYAGEQSLDQSLVKEIARKTNGVSAAFIKELMRRIAQSCLERDAEAANMSDADDAIEDMLFNGGQLNANLLGASAAR